MCGTRNYKFQFPISKQIPNCNFSNSKRFEFCNLLIEICLYFVICDLEFRVLHMRVAGFGIIYLKGRRTPWNRRSKRVKIPYLKSSKVEAEYLSTRVHV